MLTKKKKYALLAAPILALGLSAGSCDSGQPSAAQKASAERNKGVEQIRANQPVNPMDYSPTLNTVQAWTDTWGKPGVVAYVYMLRNDGTLDGYYVTDGLPVNYCVSGSPTYDLLDPQGDGVGPNLTVPAPGLDAAYYGSCDPSRYYARDAVTGQMIEYTDGFVLTAILSSEPLARYTDGEAYVSSISDVKKAGKG